MLDQNKNMIRYAFALCNYAGCWAWIWITRCPLNFMFGLTVVRIQVCLNMSLCYHYKYWYEETIEAASKGKPFYTRPILLWFQRALGLTMEIFSKRNLKNELANMWFHIGFKVIIFAVFCILASFEVCDKVSPHLLYLIFTLAKEKCYFSSANNIEGVIWIAYSIFWELLYHHVYLKNALEQLVKDRTVLEVVLVPDESPENEAHQQLKLCYTCKKRNSHLVHVARVVDDQN